MGLCLYIVLKKHLRQAVKAPPYQLCMDASLANCSNTPCNETD